MITLVCLAMAQPAAGATLVGEWAFDEGGGQVARDRSTSGIDGRLGIADGADGADPAWVPGIAGSALRFDGGDAIVLRDSPTLEPANVTIEAWLRRQGTPGAYAYVLSKGSDGCNFSSYGLYTGSGRGAAFYVSNSSGYVVSPSATPAQVWDGRWHHLAGTFDGHSVRLYLDGTQVGDGSSNDQPIRYGLQSKASFIGAYGGACQLGFSGDIDDVRVWNSALTGPDIAASRPTQPDPALGPGPSPLVASVPVPAVSGPPPATAQHCTVSISRKALRAGRRNPLVVTVRRNRRPQRRVPIQIKGKNLQVIRHTNRAGSARFVLRPWRRERRLQIRPLGAARTCAATTIAVRH